ncbi:MAG: hypothetical protein IKS74_03985 [Methanomicrobium sp.]|nr:hypothetical protein [Methanomicrobium sp.]
MKTKLRNDDTNNTKGTTFTNNTNVKNTGKFLNKCGIIRNTAKAVMIAAVIFAIIFTCGCTGNSGNDTPAHPAVEKEITALYSNNPDEQKAAVNNLVRMGNEAIIPLTKVFASGDSEASKYAAVALYTIGESSIDPLINVLNTGSQTEREWAANTLCLFEARAVPSLINVVKTGSKPAQDAAEIAIIRIGEPAIPFLELEANRGTPVTADKMRTLIYSIRATDNLQHRLAEEGNAGNSGNTGTADSADQTA